MTPDPDAAAEAADYDGATAEELRTALGIPLLRVFARVGSTMDAAHALAGDGAPHGAVVLADAQTGGRGRAGRTWASGGGTGVWLTMIARPRDPEALEVLSLRVGLALAERLDALAPATVRVKWPNDLLVGGRKLAGVLVEARWRDARPEWAAVGVGVNVRPPAGFAEAAALAPGTRRLDALAAVVGALRGAADARGLLGAPELAALAGRDAVRGRAVVAPVRGVAAGVTARGALRVEDGATAHELRQTTVVYADEPAPELPT